MHGEDCVASLKYKYFFFFSKNMYKSLTFYLFLFLKAYNTLQKQKI